MILKKMTKFAEQLVQEETIETESENLKNYNTYYFQNGYNAFDINKRDNAHKRFGKKWK